MFITKEKVTRLGYGGIGHEKNINIANFFNGD